MFDNSNAMSPGRQPRRSTPWSGAPGSRFLRALAVLVVLLGSASAIEAQTVITLAWDANTEPDVAGYQVSYGTQTGLYSTTVDVGNATSTPITLTSGAIYYFAVRAYTSSTPHLYSPYSVEVSYGLATPVITWASPASIVFGTALSATQLNASANVPGTFVYTPPTGTVLNAGAGQTLSVFFTPTDGANYSTVTKSVSIDVTAKLTPVITWANPASIVLGTPLGPTQLNATANVAGTFLYTPPAGTVLAAGAGQMLSVFFTPTDGASYTTATKSVSIDVTAKSTPVITWANPASIVLGTPLGPTQLNATANVPGTFLYTPQAGTVLTAGAGQTLSVFFTPTDGATYTTATKSVSIDVTAKTTPVITWANPASIVLGTPVGPTQLNATANVAGTFLYTPPAGTVLTAGAGQTLSVFFTPTDGAHYTTATKSVKIDVTAKSIPIVTWASPASIMSGTPLGATQLNASANVAGTYLYTPPAGTVLAAGAGQTLSVFFTPTDGTNYTTATKSVSIDVTAKSIPVITWANPASIVFGTPLSATQLNATANVPGTFVYTPPAGTVLKKGRDRRCRSSSRRATPPTTPQGPGPSRLT